MPHGKRPLGGPIGRWINNIKMDLREIVWGGIGRAMAQTVSSWIPLRRPGFEPGSCHVGFVVDKVALGQVFSEYFGFPY
jgi:hypothetical protein